MGVLRSVLYPMVLLALTLPWRTSAQDDVSVNALVGTWYLMFADQNTTYGFTQNDYSCIVVDASLSGSSSSQLLLTISLEQGNETVTQGASVAQDPSNPSRFSAVLQSDPTITWFQITDTGAVEDGQYSYVIVQLKGADERPHLYVLYSDPRADHTDLVMDYLEGAGIAAPSPIKQGVGCSYDAGETETTESSSTAELPSVAVTPVSSLEVSKYLGRWYQMMTNQNSMASMSRQGFADGVCNTVTYCAVNESAITVYNTQRQSKPRGELQDIGGIGVLTDVPGVLNVTFGTSPTVLQYWVIELGPEVGQNLLYDYAIVTDASAASLFVLARDRLDFEEKYEVDVIASLLLKGFTEDDTKPQIVLQDSSCIYPRDLEGVKFSSAGCGPDQGVPSTYWIGLLVVGLILGIGLAVGATYFLRKKGRDSNYGAF